MKKTHRYVSKPSNSFSESNLISTGLALFIFCIGCLAGTQFRRVWKANGPPEKLWAFGLVAAISLLIVGFIPISLPS
ncbi:MAG: hypothetical protein CMM76_17650 [Rhodospirillaceae bacterium]|nr:hypothetical protein [Rhodospirillaceae bacterium]